MKTRASAFTINEILVSMAIVAVLIGILFVVLPAASRSARNSDCISRLSNIYKGASLYSADHDGLYPPFAFESYGKFKANQPAFKKAVAAYDVPEEHFFCPLDKKAGTNAQGEFYSFKETSYFMGWRVYMAAKPTEAGAMLFDISAVDAPAKLMVFTDMSWLETPATGKSERFSSHGDRANNLYADGHVKNEPLEKP